MSKKNNGEGSIYYNEKKKLYVAQCTVGRDSNGKLMRKTIYAKTKKEAYQKLIDIQNKFNIGTFADSHGITLSDWITKWFEVYKKNTYKQLTYQKENCRTNRIKDSYLGRMKIDQIKPIDVQMFINNLSSELKPKSIKNILSLLNSSFKQAVIEKLIYVNPAENTICPKVPKPETVALNDKQKELFLQVAKNNPYYDFYLFALNTGMRESEIAGLGRENIHLHDRFISVERQLVKLNGKYIIDTPKTAQSIRKVPINDTAKKILEKYMYGNITNIDFVFYNPKTLGTLKQVTLIENIRKIYDECYRLSKDEVFQKATFHTLRHTFATSWIMQGGNVTLLSKTLGHTDPAFTLRVYVQPSYDDIQEEMLSMKF